MNNFSSGASQRILQSKHLTGASYAAMLMLAFLFGQGAQAQEYIDVEAEQRAAIAGEAAGLSDGAQDDSPSLSPSDPTRQGLGDRAPNEEGGAGYSGLGAGDSSNPGELLYQLQILQQEVMELRGRLEEQEYQLKQLREQSLEQYLDLDERLETGSVASTPASSESAVAGAVSNPSSQPVKTLAGEEDAYRAAYGLVRSQQFDEAILAFNQFLVDYPGGRYAPNAHYWLGELYLVLEVPDPESARRQFNLLLEQYPGNSKTPDALYKLGKIYYERGNRDRAQAYLQQVIDEHGDSGSSAVRLARDFLSSNF